MSLSLWISTVGLAIALVSIPMIAREYRHFRLRIHRASHGLRADSDTDPGRPEIGEQRHRMQTTGSIPRITARLFAVTAFGLTGWALFFTGVFLRR